MTAGAGLTEWRFEGEAADIVCSGGIQERISTCFSCCFGLFCVFWCVFSVFLPKQPPMIFNYRQATHLTRTKLHIPEGEAAERGQHDAERHKITTSRLLMGLKTRGTSAFWSKSGAERDVIALCFRL